VAAEGKSEGNSLGMKSAEAFITSQSERRTEESVNRHPCACHFPALSPHYNLFNSILKPENRSTLAHEASEVDRRDLQGEWLACR